MPSRLHDVRRAASLLCAALALCCLASTAPAQTKPAQDPATDHKGFWIGFGLGPGNLSIDCGECGVSRPAEKWKGGTSAGFYVAAGGTIRPNVLLGGELGGWTNASDEQASATTAHIGFIAQYYPLAARGLYLRGGLGVSVAALVDTTVGLSEATPLSSSGFAVKGGVGYDFRFGGSFALTPFVDYVQTFAQGDAVTARGVRYTGPKNPGSLQAGLSFNWY